MEEKEIKITIEQLSAAEGLRLGCRNNQQNLPMPSFSALKELVNLSRAILFPGYYGDSDINSESLIYHIGINTKRLLHLLTEQIKSGICFGVSEQNGEYDCAEKLDKEAKEKAIAFIKALPEIRETLQTDVEATFDGDPAAKSYGEIIYCYPGLKAVINYRLAHTLLKLDVPLIPRIISEMAHSETGIDIHPGAVIGSYFTIDHGTGVVIGETSVIGNNVKIYQGVTLGAKSFPLDENGNPIKGINRHPKIGDNVIIYSNSTVLGNITIGDGAVIGGNIWVEEDVPAAAKLIQTCSRK